MYEIKVLERESAAFRVADTGLSHETAFRRIEELYDRNKPDVTITIEDATGATVASLSTRKIIGQFTKQVWGGRKNDQAHDVGTDEFDATRYVLTMPYLDLITLEDHDDSSDEVGRAHVEWDGPHYVDIIDSITDFFGVARVGEITRQHFEYVARMKLAEYAEDERRTSIQREQVNPSSWIIRNKETGAAIMEIYADTKINVRNKVTGAAVTAIWDHIKFNALGTSKYEAVPALQHLRELNQPGSLAYQAVRAPAAGVDRAAEAAESSQLLATIARMTIPGEVLEDGTRAEPPSDPDDAQRALNDLIARSRAATGMPAPLFAANLAHQDDEELDEPAERPGM